MSRLWLLASEDVSPYPSGMAYQIEFLNGGARVARGKHSGSLKEACHAAGMALEVHSADSARVINEDNLAESQLVKSNGAGGYMVDDTPTGPKTGSAA